MIEDSPDLEMHPAGPSDFSVDDMSMVDLFFESVRTYDELSPSQQELLRYLIDDLSELPMISDFGEYLFYVSQLPKMQIMAQKARDLRATSLLLAVMLSLENYLT